ncbi:MAG: hypothetical protein RSC10_01785 [Longicatena sp.]
MNKCFVSAGLALMVGIYIGYNQEEELEDICHTTKKQKKKILKKFHKTYDHICDYMDID